MKLRGTDFGGVQGASGLQSFFKGYWFHKLLWLIGLRFGGMTFVAKTTTMNKRAGNMPMKSDGITPRERFPKSVYVDWGKEIMLNAVGLSGPGLKALLEFQLWQKRKKPFFISFMAEGDTVQERRHNTEAFVALLDGYLPGFETRPGVQINKSCPNIGVNPVELVGEVFDDLDCVRSLELPTVLKFNALLPVAAAFKISQHPACDALCVSNSIPWLAMPEKIDWKGLFGNIDESPLRRRGIPNDGGLSGAPLLPIVTDWIRDARRIGIDKPIIGGGGLHSPDGAYRYFQAGASAVFLGSIATLKPWNVARTIRMARHLF